MNKGIQFNLFLETVKIIETTTTIVDLAIFKLVMLQKFALNI
jgi:hypothetical protein